MKAVLWFDQIRLGDTALVGGKGANLGELSVAGLPVPSGFVVTADAYRQALDASGVRERLAALVEGVDPEDVGALDQVAAEAQALVRGVDLPKDLSAAVLDAYHRLGESTTVAVRSSGTGEDAADTSFAGMNATYTNVTGDSDLLERLVDCWASLYRAGHLLPGQSLRARRAHPGSSGAGDDPLRAVWCDVHGRPLYR